MHLIRPFLACAALLTAALALPPTPAAAQHGTLSAVSQFQKVTGTLAAANSAEYTSTIWTLNAQGRVAPLYVHAKLERPFKVWMSISHQAVDGPDADIVVANPNVIYEYDPPSGRVAKATPQDTSLTLPDGFSGAEPALMTVRQFFSPQPFASLLPSTELTPLLMTRRGQDLPNCALLSVQLTGGQDQAGVIGQERWAKLWVDLDKSTPRRFVLTVKQNGVEGESFREEFTSFTLNPSFPPDLFLWTPPAEPTRTAAAGSPGKNGAPPKHAGKAKKSHAARKRSAARK